MNFKNTIEVKTLIDMIEVESRAKDSMYYDEIKSPLSRIIEKADALGPLIFKEKLGLNCWRLSGDLPYSRFRVGDRVELRTKVLHTDLSTNLSYDWKIDSIKYPAPGKIDLVISGDRLLNIESGIEVFLFKGSSLRFDKFLKRKLEESVYLTEPILGSGKYDLVTKGYKFRELYEGLNNSQQQAIEYLIENNLNGTIQGPPGTGKTHLLQAVITLALDSNMKVGVTSFTHTAVDNLLGPTVGILPACDWVRVGSFNSIRKNQYKAEHINISDSFSEEINESDLIGTTMHKLAYGYKSAPKFDLLVIDEAGQVPVYFWPFIQRLAKRVVLVGDQFQLPPVLTAEHHVDFDNVFSLLLDSDTPMLETQYRMRRDIQAWSSEKFYRGRLVPHESVANRDYFAGQLAFLTDGFVVPKEFEATSAENSAKLEANYIVDKVDKLLRDNVSLDNIGVICPYRAQAGIVNAALQNRLGVEQASKVLVDTVERFQGQEREAIFMSLGNSNFTPDSVKFLSNSKRLNVSVTRAKSRFYCLYDSKLLQSSKGSHFEDLNEFLRWVKDGKVTVRRVS